MQDSDAPCFFGAQSPAAAAQLGVSHSVMKSLEKIILAAGFILAFAAGLSLLFCVVLVGSAVSKGYSVLQFVGYWPLLTIFLLLLSGCFILGAEPLAKAIGKKKSDEHKSG